MKWKKITRITANHVIDQGYGKYIHHGSVFPNMSRELPVTCI